MNRKVFALLAPLALSLALAAPAAAAGGYSIVKKVPIPGTGSWDYLAWTKPAAASMFRTERKSK